MGFFSKSVQNTTNAAAAMRLPHCAVTTSMATDSHLLIRHLGGALATMDAIAGVDARDDLALNSQGALAKGQYFSDAAVLFFSIALESLESIPGHSYEQ